MATDGNKALEAFGKERPDVMVTDLEMPGRDGLDVSTEILGEHPDPAISVQALIDDCPLTERERDVLRVASDGYSVRDIARILHLAQGTVRNYLSNAISKTHTTTRHDAARHAHEQGWI